MRDLDDAEVIQLGDELIERCGENLSQKSLNRLEAELATTEYYYRVVFAIRVISLRGGIVPDDLFERFLNLRGDEPPQWIDDEHADEVIALQRELRAEARAAQQNDEAPHKDVGSQDT